MIDQLHVAGPWLKGWSTSNLPCIPSINSDPMQGVVRVINGCVEIYNGGYWSAIPQSIAYLDMGQRSKEILNWASSKMLTEQHYAELALQHPAVSDALDAVRVAQDRLNVVVALTQENK